MQNTVTAKQVRAIAKKLATQHKTDFWKIYNNKHKTQRTIKLFAVFCADDESVFINALQQHLTAYSNILSVTTKVDNNNNLNVHIALTE